jgi:hypothetical protein
MPEPNTAPRGHFTTLFKSIPAELVHVTGLPKGSAGASVADSHVLSSIAAVFTSPFDLGLNMFMPPVLAKAPANAGSKTG